MSFQVFFLYSITYFLFMSTCLFISTVAEKHYMRCISHIVYPPVLSKLHNPSDELGRTPRPDLGIRQTSRYPT